MQNNDLLFPEDIYTEYLHSISAIKFTPREVDIISCIMSGKNPQAIANFLSSKNKSIELQTVSTHISNIRRKIAGNARGSIIDFIEKSDKHQIVRNYYLNLLIQKEFNKSLEAIVSLVSPHVARFTIVTYQVADDETLEQKDVEVPRWSNEISLINNLQNHLKLLITNVSIETEQYFTFLSALSSSVSERYFTIHVLPSLKKDYLEKTELQETTPEQKIDKKAKIIPDNNNPKHSRVTINNKHNLKQHLNSLLLFYNYEHYKDTLTNPTSIEYINLATQQNYYFLFFEILKKFFPTIETNLEKVSESFKKRYYSIHDGSHIAVSVTKHSPKNQAFIKRIYQFKKSHYIAIFLILFSLTSGFVVVSNNKGKKKNQQNEKTVESELSIQVNISNILPKFFANLSVRNLTREESEKNYSVIKQFDLVLDAIQSDQIQKYFNVNALESSELINSLYNLNAISCYTLFKEHDAKKAEKILKYAKSLAENFISSRSKIQIYFDDSTSDEIYIELSEIKDLPEMYSTTIYFLGRSFIYQKESLLAKKHFELSRDLGAKLGLFTEVLSVRSGLVIIKGDQANIEIKNRNYEAARKDLLECINTYEKIKDNGREYKKDYRPNNYDPTTIIPKNDVHNVIDCNKRIIKLYTKLIEITDDRTEQNKYLDPVLKQLAGTSTSVGWLKLLTESYEILPRIAADSYNGLGYFLLKLYDKHIEFKELKNYLVENLNLTDGDDLKIIHQIFDKAKLLSRNTEFSKVDAYDGLIMVYERLMISNTIAVEEKKLLSKKIQNLKQVKDKLKINL